MELPKPEDDQISAVPQLKEKNVDQLSEELHLLKQHVDNQFARQREYVDHQFAKVEVLIEREREHAQRLIAELKSSLIELINEKFDAARKETGAKLADFRRDMDRKLMWMIAALVGVMAGLVGVIAGQVALFFR